MDTITHAISGAVIGAATALPGHRPGHGTLRQRALWGGLFAAFPDSDFIVALFMDHFDYLISHRGITHSIVLMPMWAALLAMIPARLGKLAWKDMAMLAALALVAHICGDLITSYGTRLFAPVWNAPLAWPITFIIDPVFTAILLVGLVISVKRQAAMAARVAGVVLLAYVSMQAWLHNEAVKFGNDYAQARGMNEALVVVFPQPLSAFNWKVIVIEGETYHRAYINLVADERYSAGDEAGIVQEVWSAYRPVDDPYWQEYPKFPPASAARELAVTAWSQPEFSGFRKFALLPYVSELKGTAREVCVWFTDLRFTLPELDHPFEYAMCRAEPDEWSLQMERERED